MICPRLDTSTNLHARLMTAEREVAPRDVLEHVREVVDHGGAGRAPFLAFARLLVGRVAAEAVEQHRAHPRVARADEAYGAACFWCTRSACRVERQELLRELL